jgi:hypothetical protein
MNRLPKQHMVDATCWYFWTDFWGIFYGHFPSYACGIWSSIISFRYWINE